MKRASPAGRGKAVALGIDLGATKVVSGLVDAKGRLRVEGSRRLHANDGVRGVLTDIVASARESLEASRVEPTCVGVAVAAQVDRTGDKVAYSPNLGWRGVELSRMLARELDLPVRLINDARAATLAEWKVGAGKGIDDVFCLCLGTGVGGSAVAGGRLVRGATNAAGEVGHLTIVSGGRPCHCPNVGCLEAYVGGWALAEVAARLGIAPSGSRAGSRRTRPDAEDLFAAARRGVPAARTAVEEAEAHLADGVVSITHAFNPTVIVLVGGLVRGWPRLVRVAQRAVRARCEPPLAEVRVVPGLLGPHAGVVGAGLYALGG
jgi:glucokinase